MKYNLLSKALASLRFGLHPDLLRLYIRNHNINWWYYGVVFASFVTAKLYLYGTAFKTEDFVVLIGLIIASTIVLMMLRDDYQVWLQDKVITNNNQRKIVLKVIMLRCTFLIPWLIFLFYPLETDIFYLHLLGYCFIFCAISTYASVSSPYYPLLIVDIGILVLFSLFLMVYNNDAPEFTYVQIMISAFAAASLLTSLRNNSASKKFISNENALKKVAKEAAESSKAKADFLAVMSHEIRTPMTGVMGMVDFLKDTKLTKDQEQCLDTITQCSKTLLNTINDVLDISKIEAGQMAISPIDFDFKGMMKGVEKTFETMASQKGIGFKVALDEATPQFIHADPNRMQQILLNLTNNAIKFTETGGVTISVSYETMVRIEVSDTGIGISPEQQKKLFQKFSQVDGSISRKYGGTGLGLYIAQSLVKRMNGRIGFDSVYESGSTFWFELPYVGPQNDEESLGAMNVDDQHYTTMNILLVDDNALNRQIISKYLGKYHCVTAAQNGWEAIDLVQNESFDIILMDLQMPNLNGFETTLKIKRIGGDAKNIPILAMSANVLEKDMIKCKQVGMLDHIAKPIDKAQMFNTIEKYASNASSNAVADQQPVNNSIPLDSADTAYSNDAIDAMIEQLGLDYVRDFLKDSNVAILELEKEIDQNLKDGNCAAASFSAHNMVSLLGNIGFIQSAHVAQSIEKLCKDEALTQAKSTYSMMQDALHKELEKLKQAYDL